jgi:hypothetical protein
MTTKHINLRLSPEMHSLLVAVAERNHRSLNGEIEWAIDRHLQREEQNGDLFRDPATHYQDSTGWHRKHDVYGGPRDEPPAEVRDAPRESGR